MRHLTTAEWIWLATAAGYIVVAGVNTMPNPGEKIDRARAYKWFYDWIHMLLNSPAAQRIEQRFSSAGEPK